MRQCPVVWWFIGTSPGRVGKAVNRTWLKRTEPRGRAPSRTSGVPVIDTGDPLAVHDVLHLLMALQQLT